MSPVSLNDEVSYMPLALVASHILMAILLTCLVGQSFYRSYLKLRPLQETRRRVSSRSKLVPLFASLSVLSLLLCLYSGISYAVLSYKVWAEERGIMIPEKFGAVFGRADRAGEKYVYLNRWLNDTPIYTDAFEIVFEKARRLWWGQQVELGLIPWTMLLAIEGRRRQIPYLWAFLSLAHLVNLSFAQNLFYVALLLTPSPLPSNVMSRSRLSRIVGHAFPPKPSNWSPRPILFWVSLILNYGAVFLLPFAPGTVSATKTLAWARALSFAPLVLPVITPESWVITRSHSNDLHSSFSRLFRAISVLNFVFHGTVTAAGIFGSLPGSYRHRHSTKIPFDTEKRSKWERTATAAERVLGSVSDHPSVASASRDVILSALSLGLWAALRSFESSDMFMSAIPWYSGPSSARREADGRSSADQNSVESEPSLTIAADSSRGRGRRSSMTAAKSDRSLKRPGPTRRRGSPRKMVLSESESDLDEVRGDMTYQPGPEEESSALEGDSLRPEGFTDWESAAISWGLTTLGGLGLGSAAVFGAECIVR